MKMIPMEINEIGDKCGHAVDPMRITLLTSRDITSIPTTSMVDIVEAWPTI